MEYMLAKKLSELDFDEVLKILMKLNLTDPDAFESLAEILEDL
jgi:hypothetical protein